MISSVLGKPVKTPFMGEDMDFLKVTLPALLSAGVLFFVTKTMEKHPATPYDLNRIYH